MAGSALSGWVVSSLMLSLRVGPAFVFAPPFTLTRMPGRFRVLLALGLSACLTAGRPAVSMETAALVAGAARELFLGLVVVVALQGMFGALYVAGRTIDIQAGYGLATLIDPTSQAQTPLVGTLFALTAGMVFFGLDGHLELLRILQASLDAVPIGTAAPLPSVPRIAAFLSAAFVTALGVGGGVVLVLFLADAAIALMSRTIPQMNVLMLGFQVKTLLLLFVLPLSLGASAALLVRLMRVTLEAIPGLL